MLAGLIAGIAAFAVARLVGVGPVESAIGLEEHASHEHGEAAELVSRGTQSGLGLAVATVVFGIALGGILALAVAVAYGRIGPLGPQGTVVTLGAIGFAAVYLVPFLKYPANPPAVGNPATIGERTSWYFAMIAISACVAIAALVIRARLVPRSGQWNATVLAAAVFAVPVALAGWLLPAADVDYGHFPAPLLWEFRIASIGIQAALWVVLALVFAPLAGRTLRALAPAEPAAVS